VERVSLHLYIPKSRPALWLVLAVAVTGLFTFVTWLALRATPNVEGRTTIDPLGGARR
jgi:hypothetical protein